MARHRKGYIFQRKKRGTYYLQFNIDGKRTVQSLGTKNKDEAESKRQEVMDGFKVGDEVHALESIASKISTRKQELEKLDELKNPPLSIADAWGAFEQAGNRRDIASSTMQIYFYYWQGGKNGFLKWLAKEYPEVTTLNEITYDVAEKYKAYMTRVRKVTGRTFNAHRSFMRMFFNVLEEKARLSENPWKRITRKVEHSKGREPLTVDELKAVCQGAEGELRTMLALGLYLGARMGDACTLQWGNVDMVRRVIHYLPRKTSNKVNEQLVIPMHPSLFQILSESAKKSRKGFLTPDLASLYTNKGPYAVSALVQAHFRNTGLETTSEGKGVRRNVTKGFHSLRHSAVSLMREAGTAQSISQAVVGHSSTEVHQLYTHADEDALRRAVSALPAMTDEREESLPVPKMVDSVPLLKIAEKLNGKNWKKCKAELTKLLQE